MTELKPIREALRTERDPRLFADIVDNGGDAVRDLVLAGADVNARWGAVATTPLAEAAARGQDWTVAALRSLGADPTLADRDGLQPLHRAGSPAAVAAIVADPKVDVDAVAPLTGATPLITAACNGNRAVVAALIERMADVHAADGRGMTALHHAVLSADVPTVQALLDAKADPNAADAMGMTPLHLATMYHGMAPLTDVAVALVRAGGDYLARDADGSTPMDFANAKHDRSLIKAMVGAEKVAERPGPELEP